MVVGDHGGGAAKRAPLSAPEMITEDDVNFYNTSTVKITEKRDAATREDYTNPRYAETRYE